ncbi:hypothetical protein [Frigidibacter sp. SD6-1]|uniref:hypothetical protein n=1 Tax=Frigidibacter sp. SD6-1 TaxID=3032581 RepID=UPI0024E03C7E|nr:hypothetical protein [Frigidibacter sp. SD6-1]
MVMLPMRASLCFLQVRQCLHCNQAMLGFDDSSLVQLTHPALQSALDAKSDSNRGQQHGNEYTRHRM